MHKNTKRQMTKSSETKANSRQNTAKVNEPKIVKENLSVIDPDNVDELANSLPNDLSQFIKTFNDLCDGLLMQIKNAEYALRSYYDGLNNTIQQCNKMLNEHDGELSQEEKKWYVEQIAKSTNLIKEEKDIQDKKHSKRNTAIMIGGGIGIGTGLAVWFLRNSRFLK